MTEPFSSDDEIQNLFKWYKAARSEFFFTDIPTSHALACGYVAGICCFAAVVQVEQPGMAALAKLPLAERVEKIDDLFRSMVL